MRLTLHCCECAAHTQLALSLKHTSPCWIFVMDGVTQSWPTALQMRAKMAAGALTDPKQQRAPCRHLFIFVLIVMWLLPSLFLQRWFIGLRSNHGQQCDWTASVDHCLGEHTLNKLRPRMALTDWSKFIKWNMDCITLWLHDVCPALPMCWAHKPYSNKCMLIQNIFDRLLKKPVSPH